jgi:hypothetical protein
MRREQGFTGGCNCCARIGCIWGCATGIGFRNRYNIEAKSAAFPPKLEQ